MGRYADVVRQVLPSDADRVLNDATWPALTTTIAKAETADHNPRRLLTKLSAERELETAKSPAQVLIWRVTAQPNKRQAAAAVRSTSPGTARASTTSATISNVASSQAVQEERHRRRGR
ncbi:hypothetical protein [Streptomyces iconiensis]|uniref:Transposase n=1 Tax=Streptomyces iconiensis TaxID=1384038 RepID=A0ABT7AAU9_9ACTN|nr:hypothetical protein [Streptomyces iconiensis]MDJ1138473.1 hypothetical protein [Streptomyces iconiensis]